LFARAPAFQTRTAACDRSCQPTCSICRSTFACATAHTSRDASRFPLFQLSGDLGGMRPSGLVLSGGGRPELGYFNPMLTASESNMLCKSVLRKARSHEATPGPQISIAILGGSLSLALPTQDCRLAVCLLALEEFRSLGIQFISYQENIDTTSPLGQALFTIVSAAHS